MVALPRGSAHDGADVAPVTRTKREALAKAVRALAGKRCVQVDPKAAEDLARALEGKD